MNYINKTGSCFEIHFNYDPHTAERLARLERENESMLTLLRDIEKLWDTIIEVIYESGLCPIYTSEKCERNSHDICIACWRKWAGNGTDWQQIAVAIKQLRGQLETDKIVDGAEAGTRKGMK